MKIVLDTNIIVSSFLNPQGLPGEIVSLVLTKKLTVCYDNKIFFEYTEVLTRSRFNFNGELVNDFLEFVKNNGEYIVAESQKIKFIDEDDKIFYDVYKSSDAEYIITGNTRHFPQEKNIITPKEFIEILQAELKD
ncbi:MAG: putative toxin-antitoxin system toxin component, PIN family [Prevotellaceae bacterium]|jgi:putative PIN family toxin of toxin-antitoxin system|nr:putative toxin-antitoxin system toxin component, PIN family [Prevotellaceae bacterium]